MSNLIHCDGPGCNKTRAPSDGYSIELCALPWIRVNEGTPSRTLDFCSRACLAAWTTGKPQATSDSQPCTCDGSQLDPHTISQHRPGPGGRTRDEVNGL